MQNLTCEKEFYLHEEEKIINIFHINGFALSVTLKQRLGTT